MSSGTPPALVSIAAPTIARASIRRYLSKSESSTHDASGSPSSSGTAAPPVPDDHACDPLRMCRRREQGGRGPDVRPDDVGRPRPASSISLCQELAHRPRGEEIVSGFGRAEARQVNGEQAGMLGELGPDRRKRVHALRPRDWSAGSCAQVVRRSRRTGSEPRQRSGTGAVWLRWLACGPCSALSVVARAVEHPGQVPGSQVAFRLGAARRFQPWKAEWSSASHASRSPGVLRSQSGRICRETSRRSCQRSTTDGRPQNQ